MAASVLQDLGNVQQDTGYLPDGARPAAAQRSVELQCPSGRADTHPMACCRLRSLDPAAIAAGIAPMGSGAPPQHGRTTWRFDLWLELRQWQPSMDDTAANAPVGMTAVLVWSTHQWGVLDSGLCSAGGAPGPLPQVQEHHWQSCLPATGWSGV